MLLNILEWQNYYYPKTVCLERLSRGLIVTKSWPRRIAFPRTSKWEKALPLTSSNFTYTLYLITYIIRNFIYQTVKINDLIIYLNLQAEVRIPRSPDGPKGQSRWCGGIKT